MSVDENDNDPIVLLTYVAAALDRVSPLDPGVFDALASPGVSVEATVVPRLGAALATIEPAGRPGLSTTCTCSTTRHASTPSRRSRGMFRTAHSWPSRRAASPALPLAALRARGLALEIGPDDLRMDEAEARQLLSAAGVELPDEQIAELTEHTEGWSAGLYLAALSIRARGVKAEGAATFSGSDRLVSDYLRSELLAHLSPDDLRFLTRTAVLERMSGPLCDAVLEASGSAASSGVAGALQPVPGPAGPRWASGTATTISSRSCSVRSWHEPSRSSYPRSSLARPTGARRTGSPRRRSRTHRRPATSTEWRGCSSVAAQPAYQSGRVATAERWLDWLERHGALERNAAVAVLGALIAAVQGRPAEAERWAEAAERASYDGHAARRQPLDRLVAGPPERAALSSEGVARMRADAELAVRTLARGSPFRPTALLLLAVSQWLAGEIDEADDLFADVAEEGLELGALEPVAVALGERAAIAIGREAWVQAEELVDRALLVIRRSRMEEYPTSAFVYAVAARVALHRGDAERAQELLARAQRLRPRLTYALPYLAVQTRLELARAYLTLADAGGARTMLREIDALLRRQPDLGTLPAQVEELRSQPEDDARRGARGLDPHRGGAAPAPLPGHPPVLPRDRRAPLRIAPHGEVARDGHLPQAQRHLSQRRGRARPRARPAVKRWSGRRRSPTRRRGCRCRRRYRAGRRRRPGPLQ